MGWRCARARVEGRRRVSVVAGDGRRRVGDVGWRVRRSSVGEGQQVASGAGARPTLAAPSRPMSTKHGQSSPMCRICVFCSSVSSTHGRAG